MMDETLLNCPLCGGEARFETYGGTACAVVCQSCHCGTPTMSLVDGMAAVNRWNLRAERTCRVAKAGELRSLGFDAPGYAPGCSECGYRATEGMWDGWTYCPCCGARVVSSDGA